MARMPAGTEEKFEGIVLPAQVTDNDHLSEPARLFFGRLDYWSVDNEVTMTIREMSLACGKHFNSVDRYLRELQAENLINRRGNQSIEMLLFPAPKKSFFSITKNCDFSTMAFKARRPNA